MKNQNVLLQIYHTGYYFNNPSHTISHKQITNVTSREYEDIEKLQVKRPRLIYGVPKLTPYLEYYVNWDFNLQSILYTTKS